LADSKGHEKSSDAVLSPFPASPLQSFIAMALPPTQSNSTSDFANYIKGTISTNNDSITITVESTATAVNATAPLAEAVPNPAYEYTTPPNITVDWSCRASAVINQGQCGACYAFGALESIYISLLLQQQPVASPLSIQ
jgi:C1A family cysteine protease